MKPITILLLTGWLAASGALARAEFTVPQAGLDGGGGLAAGGGFRLAGACGASVAGAAGDSLLVCEAGFPAAQRRLCLLGWDNHAAGNCVLTITNQGILGFTDGSQSEGAGFVYPAGGMNQIYVGGLWVGQSDTYVANRDYDDDPQQEWRVSRAPDGHVWRETAGESDEDLHACFNDSAAVQPRGIFVAQESWVHTENSLAPHHVLLRYEIENHGSTALTGLYAGVFLDIDIGPDFADNNWGAVDGARDLVYLTDAAGIHIGLALLRDALGEPQPSNVTLIHNPTFIWPQAYALDADKYAFLAAADPEHVLLDSEAIGPSDYSVLAAAGPFDLEPGEAVTIAWAVAGGATRDDLRNHIDAARLIYASGYAAAPPPEVPHITRLHAGRPNPFRGATVIRFDLARAAEIDVAVYDVSGRRVRTLARGARGPMRYLLTWDGRDGAGRSVAAGVYFLRLDAGPVTESRRLVRVR